MTASNRIASSIAAFVAAFATACGGAGAPEPGSAASAEEAVGGEATGMAGPDGELSWEDRQLMADYEEEVGGLERELSAAMELQAGPDCANAGRFAQNICDLAGRICAIRDEHPDNDDVAAMCTDANERCERATADVADRCGG